MVEEKLKKVASALLDKYKQVSKPKESVIIFVYKKELGWEILKLAYEQGYKIINKTLPFYVEYKTNFDYYDFGFHNADIPYEEREEIEDAFRKGKLKCLISTSTLAYGVNLPADRVIILLTSFYDKEKGKMITLPSITDVIQMEGRAGRFGIKEIGYVHILRYRTSKKTYDKVYEETFNSSDSEIVNALKNIDKIFDDYLGEAARLSSFILSAYKISNGDVFEFLKRTFSFKDFNDKRKITFILDFLTQKKYIENNKITKKGEFCLSSGIPPTAYEEFLKRAKIKGDLFVKIRPLIWTKRIKDCLKPFLTEEDVIKFYDKSFLEALKPFDYPEDGSHELIFYIKGGLFKLRNIHNPPSELYLGTEVLHLSKALIKISDYFFLSNEDILRIAHSLRYGIDYEFSPIGSIGGIGHMRANAIKLAISLNHKIKNFSFENKVSDILDLLDEKTLKEVLSMRYTHSENIKREASNILNALSKNRDKVLIDEYILRGISLFKLDKESALKLPVNELLNKYLES